MAGKANSLDAWLEQNTRPRPSFWNDLPEDIREQIISSDASSKRITEWLVSIGYDGTNLPEATPQKIDAPRRKERQRRERTTDPG
jgi:hypothetical protein